MSAIRGRGNKDTELRMMMLLRAQGLSGWQRGVAVFGKPDFASRQELVTNRTDWPRCCPRRVCKLGP